MGLMLHSVKIYCREIYTDVESGKASKMIKKILGFAAIFLLATQLHANEKNTAGEYQWQGTNQKGEIEYTILYQESGKWILDNITESPGSLQRLANRQIFDTFEKAEPFARFATKLHKKIDTRSLDGISPEFITEEPYSVLWEAKNNWSWEWEKKYARWVSEELDASFYTKYKIATDCADAVIAAKWIFSRINSLPIGNSLAGSGKLFTNRSMKTSWTSLPTSSEWHKDKRFLAGLNYILNQSYTSSLMRDSSPVAINKDAFTAGIHHLDLYGSGGHAMVVNKVETENPLSYPVTTLSSTVPRKVRELSEGGFWGSQQPKAKDGGFLRIRWLITSENGVQKLISKRDMPHYSLEQYAPDFTEGKSFSLAIIERLIPGIDYLEILKDGVSNLKNQFLARIVTVEKGFEFCSKNSCEKGSGNYENWSTPSRDKRILELTIQLENLFYQLVGQVDGMYAYWTNTQKERIFNFKGYDISLKALQFIWKSQSFASDPNDPVDKRWGVLPNDFLEARKTNLYEVFESRQGSIEDALKHCYQNEACRPGSQLFETHQTYDIDLPLPSISSITREYCDHFSESLCGRYKGLLVSDTLSFAGLSLTVSEWLDRLPWLSADPRQGQKSRWGENASLFDHTHSSVEPVL